MIDLHTHILPGVDDGVQTEEDAVEFARMAWDDGVRTIVATPHCKEGFFVNDRETVARGVARLRALVDEARIAIAIVPGAEVHLAPDLVARVRDGRAPTLADNGKTLLLELSLSQYPVELENLVFTLKLADIEPVFAHPERIRYFQDDVRRYESIVRLGAHGQITTGSILGQFGSDAREFSVELLRRGLVDVLASDAHNTGRRPPLLSEALAAIVPLVGARRAESMVHDVPRALLAGEVPEVPPVDGDAARRRSIFGGWFRRRGSRGGAE
jgi:protein-tyrosine phosphatase